jgi:hypothetical protein
LVREGGVKKRGALPPSLKSLPFGGGKTEGELKRGEASLKTPSPSPQEERGIKGSPRNPDFVG